MRLRKKVDADKPIPEVKAEAEKMDVQQLKDTAMKYKEAITAKMQEVQQQAEKLKDIPPADIMTKGKDIQAKIEQLKPQIDALKDRLQVYIDELKKKGGDISGLQI